MSQVCHYQSYGIGVEIATFKEAGKPIFYMTPGIVPAELLADLKC